MRTCNNKLSNIAKAQQGLIDGAKMNADVLVLPQFFNSPYNMKLVPEYAEQIIIDDSQQDSKLPYDFQTTKPLNTSTFLSKMSKHLQKHIIAGSIPQIQDGKFYNTCLCFDSSGNLKTKFRKLHLFDIDIPGKMTFKESEILTGGKIVGIFDTPFAKFGIGICYDIRFPQYNLLLSQKYGVNFLCYPAAFNKTTGPMHWDLLRRSRAIDSQCFVAMAAPAQPQIIKDGVYPAYGHSSIVSPWGKVIEDGGEDQKIVVGEIDMNLVDQVKASLQYKKQKRIDLYSLDSPASIKMG